MKTPKVGTHVYAGLEYKVLLVGRMRGRRAVVVKWGRETPYWIYLGQLPLEEK